MAAKATKPTECLATPAEVSAYLRVPEDTLKDWRYKSTGPRWIRVGKFPRYDWDDVREWKRENTQQTY
ncbi:helix-turn-helix transcriptional regulator [Spirillospora sp. CA-253888]